MTKIFNALKILSNKIKAFFEMLSDTKSNLIRGVVYLVFSALPVVSYILLLYSPICVTKHPGMSYVVNAIGAFDSLNSTNYIQSSFAYLQLGAFIAIMALILVNFLITVRGMFIISKDSLAAKNAKLSVIIGVCTSAVFTVFSYVMSPINRLTGGSSYSDVDLGPIIYSVAIAVLFAIFVGVATKGKERKEEDLTARIDKRIRKKQRMSLLGRQLELFIYAIITLAVAAAALLSNIITVVFDSNLANIKNFVLNGSKLLFNPNAIVSDSERMIAYILFVMAVIIVTMFILTAVSFLSRSSMFYKLSLASVLIGSAICLCIAMFGKYYEIVQQLNQDIINSLFEDSYVGILDWQQALSYEVKSFAIYFFIGEIVIISLLFFRNPYTKALRIEKEIEAQNAASIPQAVELTSADIGFNSLHSQPASADNAAPKTSEVSGFDPCPPFSEIDGLEERFREQLSERRQMMFEEPTLPKLVDFIVQYARDSRLHLFYTPENIAAFLAGLGMTKLSVLQGMSGTGKTSLPKIVAEALNSVCDIVEVESSWRDKNELLGYYNEFSKTYTPKKFTQALYRAALNPDTLTFIVLDEMNLSRIEYYFSDFLSIMENEPDKREIKLLNVAISRKNGNESLQYRGLIDGHTLKIPQNIWFIGTANRDESTFDISDKVYDRAHTMNFDKRAPKAQFYNEPIERRYVPAPVLQELFDRACDAVSFDLDSYPAVKEMEKLLEPYNISFGNRIALQIERFVKIYVSCFSVTEENIKAALETILLSKVVRKLELKSVDDKEALAERFEAIGFSKCAEFIMNLQND